MMPDAFQTRQELSKKLHEIMHNLGFPENVYFQPPNNIKMKYPAIRYNVDGVDNKHADNESYHLKLRYSITVIDPNPDSTIWMEVMKLPLCKFDRFYTAPGLNHWAFNLYY